MKTLFLSLFVFCTTLPLLAQEETTTTRRQGTFLQTLVMIAIAILFFYFILWRPEQKRRKQMEQQRSALKKGDQVTAMGIIGTVVKIQENTVILKLYDGAKIEMLKAAITDVKPSTAEVTVEDASEGENK